MATVGHLPRGNNTFSFARLDPEGNCRQAQIRNARVYLHGNAALPPGLLPSRQGHGSVEREAKSGDRVSCRNNSPRTRIQDPDAGARSDALSSCPCGVSSVQRMRSYDQSIQWIACSGLHSARRYSRRRCRRAGRSAPTDHGGGVQRRSATRPMDSLHSRPALATSYVQRWRSPRSLAALDR